VRPFVQEDGGDITYLDFEEDTGVVTLQMKGACAGCPSSAVTLKNGIENMLKHYVAEVTTVQAVDEVLEE
jgi:Fe-S cluster biogenesis protein NfuA